MTTPTRFRPPVSEKEIFDSDSGPSMLAGDAIDKGYRNVVFIGKNAIEEELTGVIQPCFDWDMDPNDQSFLNSVGPFWSTKADGQLARDFQPEAWATPFIMWPFMGDNFQHFFSPANRKKMVDRHKFSEDDFADAFHDMYHYLRFGKQFTQEDRDYYTKRVGKTDSARVPNRTSRFCSLIIGHDKADRKDRPMIIAYTTTAHNYLLTQARWRREEEDPILDPKNKRYLLGDPTRVEGALPFRVAKLMVDPTDPQETNCLLWCDDRQVLNSPLKQRPITEAELAMRYNLSLSTNWVFPTYQEQIDFMVDQYRDVDVELIKEACGHRGDVGERKERLRPARTAPAEVESDEEDDAALKAAVARALGKSAATSTKERAEPSLPPGAKVVTPAPVDPVDAETFLAGAPGGKPVRMTKAEIRDLVATAPDSKVKIDGAWQFARDVVPVWFPVLADEDEEIPGDDDDDVIPGDDDDEIPMDPAPVAKGAIDINEVRKRSFPMSAYNGLSPEDKTAADVVMMKIEQLKQAGSNIPEDLSEEIFRYVTLGQKAAV